jgi:3-deoxy-D-manno-octulosonic acid kinase
MNLQFEQAGARAIVYDAECIQQPGAHLFDPEHWRKLNAVVGTAPGRGNALMLNTPFGPAVLRACLRGGWAARFSRDRYVYTGFRRSRPLLEARVLEKLLRMGMPVPQPLAAQCLRSGFSYTGALLTRRIMPASSLADLLENLSEDNPCWLRTGHCIRRFHDIGLVHPDLNARNILVNRPADEPESIYLVDFDGAYICADATRLFRSNLKRLRRSLLKLWPAQAASDMESCWKQLIIGYNTGIGYNNGNGYNKGNGYNTGL